MFTLLVLLAPAEVGASVVAAPELGFAADRPSRCEGDDEPRDSSSRRQSLASMRM